MILDIIVIAVLLISAIIAFLRGLIREILTIAGVVGGLAAAYFGAPVLIPFMNGWLGVKESEEPQKLFDIIPYDVLSVALSYGLIFIIVVILLSITSHFLAESVRKLGLGAIDRTLGFIFGLLRGILILGLLYIPLHYISDEKKDEYLGESKTRFYLERTSESLLALFPQEAKESINESVQEIDKDIETGLDAREKMKLLESPPEIKEDENASESGGYDEEFRDKMDALFEDNTATDNNP